MGRADKAKPGVEPLVGMPPGIRVWTNPPAPVQACVNLTAQLFSPHYILFLPGAGYCQRSRPKRPYGIGRRPPMLPSSAGGGRWRPPFAGERVTVSRGHCFPIHGNENILRNAKNSNALSETFTRNGTFFVSIDTKFVIFIYQEIIACSPRKKAVNR